MGVSNDADTCVPTAVTDFIFDLSDSVIRSQILEEQTRLYAVTFKDLCSKYFASSQWPSPQAIASECNGNPLFLAIYREVTHRHWHNVSRPSARDRVEGWSVYRELLEELLDEENFTQSQAPFYMLPDWCFDILHEFVYQFQGYCQFRTAVYATAKKNSINLDGTPMNPGQNVPHHLLENLTQLDQNREAWAIESVVEYLYRLISVANTSNHPGYQYLGIFSSICLSRLECLLGDFPACLQAATKMNHVVVTIPASFDTPAVTTTAPEIVKSVVGARLSLAYHTGVAYLMLRRFPCACTTLSDVCSYLLRGFKTGQLSRKETFESKLLDRMVALLALLMYLVPPRSMEESLTKAIREKHASQLAKLEDNSKPEKQCLDLFGFASPKFITPTPAGPDVYALQMSRFQKLVSSLQESRKLRSYMKLYTVIDVQKLAAFYQHEKNDSDGDGLDDFTSLLLSYKHLMHQEEMDGKTFKSALDISYHVHGTTVYMDEAEKQRRFENYFMTQIRQNEDIYRLAQQI